MTKVAHCVFISTKLRETTTSFEECADNSKTKAKTGIFQKKNVSKVGPNEILIIKAHFYEALLLNVKHLQTVEHFYQSKISSVTC